MSTPSSTPQAQGHTPGAPRWVPIVFVVLFLLTGYLILGGVSSRRQFQAQLGETNQKIGDLSAQLDKANTTATDLRGELDLTAQKLGITEQQLDQARKTAQAARREQMLSSRKFQEQLGQMEQEHTAQMGELGGEIQSTQKDLNDTKGKLDRTVGDMGVVSGLVAHNQSELDQLKRLNERNIFEFNLHKSKYPSRVGPIMVALNKADAKHWRYTMDVVVEDKRIQKKDKTLYEPVQFYVQRSHAPYEIVVFQIKKNEIVGYLTTPKEAAAAGTAVSANVSPGNK